MATTDANSEVLRILHEQEMRGERLVNHIRLGFYLLSTAALVANFPANTDAANQAFVVQIGLALTYTALLYAWFAVTKGRYAPRLKYVSITLDLSLLHMGAFIMAGNTSGAIEYLYGLVPVVIVLWNLLTALRNSVAACLFSAALTGLLSSLVLWWMVGGGDANAAHVAFEIEKSNFGAGVIGIVDEATRVFFMVLTAGASAAIAWTSRRLIVQAARDSLDRAELEQQKARLSKYLSKDLAELIVQDPSLFQLGGTRKHATILFSDIRNFTPLAESVEPEQVVTLLNGYFTRMVSIVFDYGGTLDKFLGDGLMAEFGVPFELPDHELRAVLVALEMVEQVEEFNAEHRLEDRGLTPLSIGVGVATGPVVAGNIGSPERMEYTTIGDTVNFAARLEALNKQMGTLIIVSADTAAAIRDHLPLDKLPPVQVKGKSGEPELYAVARARISPEQRTALKARLKQAEPAPEA
jgi:class 3 adenylate cyclase